MLPLLSHPVCELSKNLDPLPQWINTLALVAVSSQTISLQPLPLSLGMNNFTSKREFDMKTPGKSAWHTVAQP